MLGGLTPIGLTFVAVLMVAMTIGVSAAIYYSWISPVIQRSRQRKRDEAEKALAAARDGSPHLPGSPYTDNKGLDTPYIEQENGDPIFAHDMGEGDLSPPAPVYAFQNKGRFSTSTQDGIWWVV